VPFPLPLVGETVIHETFFDTVQPQFAVTETVPLLPDADAETELGEIVKDSALLPLLYPLYETPAELTAETQ
jgi:hypothetical protein